MSHSTPHIFTPNAAVALLAGLVLFLTLFGCARPVEHHGYFDPRNLRETLEPTVSTRQDVLVALGNPSFEGAFNSSKWYYLGQSFKINILLPPTEINRELVAIHFDDADFVTHIETYGLSDGLEIVPETDMTPVVDKDLSAVEQILSNIGKVGSSAPSP